MIIFYWSGNYYFLLTHLYLQEMAEFFRYKGMGAAPQIVLNGQQVNIEDDFETSLSMVQ